jgi:hypothetical protein
MAFRVNPDVDGFVLVDSAGGTHLISPSQMEKTVKY